MYIATLRGCRPTRTLRASFPPPPLKSICRDKPFPLPKHVASSETTPAVDDPFASSCAATALRSVDSVSANAIVARAVGGRTSARPQLLQMELPPGAGLCGVDRWCEEAREKNFLFEIGIDLPPGTSEDDLSIAVAAWNSHVQRKRSSKVARRPVADVMIGALAQANDGLITRNASDFRALFPSLNIVTP